MEKDKNLKALFDKINKDLSIIIKGVKSLSIFIIDKVG